VNADCIVIAGSNMAECHPVAFQWVTEAKRRGATVIHVDPRFTRTSALASKYVPVRAGSDIVFLGALVNHVLSGGHEFRDYVTAYTNAADMLPDEFTDTEDGGGVFSGYDPHTRTYDNSSWQPTGERDLTLTHPRCVFQVLKRHFARYTPDLVERACGIEPRDFAAIADAVVANSGRERTTAWVYAVGWTQHTTGVQHIRTAAILQLLLGNMGRPGGGILALRGHASIQGSTDIPTLFHLLPGYLPMPAADDADLNGYLTRLPDTGFWGNKRAYMVSLLKAWFGDAATTGNDFCFDRLPRITGEHGTYRTVLDMIDGKVKGYFLMGQNPAVGSAGARLQRLAMANLDGLVVRDLTLIESATFWRDGPEIATGELATEQIATEVFFLPAASHVEKDGTFTNTQRMLQWHHKALDPPGDARSELWFMYHLGKKIRARLAGSGITEDAVLDLTWDYPEVGEHADPDASAVLREINGTGPDGRALDGFAQLAADGSTACGCWIYSGCYGGGENQTARRVPWQQQSWVAPQWGWAWPANRRILYNRASADPAGKPWSEKKAYVWWDAEAGSWTGHDVPDFERSKPPGFSPEPGASGPMALGGSDPFIMMHDGKGALFVPSGLVDGPLPAHYEPAESPVGNAVYKQGASPVSELYPEHKMTRDQLAPGPSEPAGLVYPYVLTTYRLTEHHTAGGMSRTLSRLAELQPEMFCEVSPALAAARGLENGGWATIVSARAAIEARVLVTRRIRPLRLPGEGVIHQVGLPYHWGGNGLVTGDSANDLLPFALDPNVFIQESKVATCDIRPGRRPRGAALDVLVAKYRHSAGLPDLPDNRPGGGVS